jgi:hypothetical protein
MPSQRRVGSARTVRARRRSRITALTGKARTSIRCTRGRNNDQGAPSAPAARGAASWAPSRLQTSSSSTLCRSSMRCGGCSGRTEPAGSTSGIATRGAGRGRAGTTALGTRRGGRDLRAAGERRVSWCSAATIRRGRTISSAPAPSRASPPKTCCSCRTASPSPCRAGAGLSARRSCGPRRVPCPSPSATAPRRPGSRCFCSARPVGISTMRRRYER